MQMFAFLGWWRSLAGSVAGLGTGEELPSSHPGPGALQRHGRLPGLSQALLGSSRRMGWDLRWQGMLSMVICSCLLLHPIMSPRTRGWWAAQVSVDGTRD